MASSGTDSLSAPPGRALRRALLATRHCALAVSGGRDSMLLLFLASLIARRKNMRLFVFCINHGLRPEAARECAFVAQYTHRLGGVFASKRLGDPPGSGNIQNWARAGRYAALADLCRQHGCRQLLLGHHYGDRAETWSMLAARIGAFAALRGMPARFYLQDVRSDLPILVQRPFLWLQPEEIERLATKCAVPFMHDPGNDDLRYARVRARKKLRLGISPCPPPEKARAAARVWRCHARAAARDFFAAGGIIHRAGFLAIPRRAFCEGSFSSRRSLWELMSGAVSRGGLPVASFKEFTQALAARKDKQGPVCLGCWRHFQCWAVGKHLYFIREAAAVTGRADKSERNAASYFSGSPLLWDGRFHLQTLGKGRLTHTIRPAGKNVKALESICRLVREKDAESLFWREAGRKMTRLILSTTPMLVDTHNRRHMYPWSGSAVQVTVILMARLLQMRRYVQ